MSYTQLNAVFISFARGNTEIDGKQFAKLVKDTKLVDNKNFTIFDIDLIFTSVKDQSARKLSYNQFEKAIGMIAKKKNMVKEELLNEVLLAGGPKFEGTKANYTRLHDDKSLYTGITAHSVASTNDSIIRGSLKSVDSSVLCDLSFQESRFRKKTM